MICQHKIKFFSLIDVRLCLSPTQSGAEADGGDRGATDKKRGNKYSQLLKNECITDIFKTLGKRL